MASVAILSAIALGGTAFEEVSRVGAAEARKRAIDKEMREQKLAADQQTLSRNNQLKRVMSTQLATEGGRGIDPASGSFKALTIDQFNNLAQDQKSINLNLDTRLDNLKTEKSNINNSLLSGVATNLFDLAKFGEGLQS